MTQAIVKKTLAEQIYDALKDDILSRRLTFGEKLVNRELQERFGVSSSPIRDAINRLQSDGLLEEVTNNGAKIISFDIHFAMEINEFIAIICTSALELSAKKNDNTNEISAKLFEILHDQENAADTDEYFFHDYKFHKVFFDYCGNDFLKETYVKYNVLRAMLTKYAYEKDNNKDEALHQHYDIAYAYKEADFARAKELMVGHYQSGIKKLSSVFDQQSLSGK